VEDGPAGLGRFEVQAGGLCTQHIYSEIELILAAFRLNPICGGISEAGFVVQIATDLSQLNLVLGKDYAFALLFHPQESQPLLPGDLSKGEAEAVQGLCRPGGGHPKIAKGKATPGVVMVAFAKYVQAPVSYGQAAPHLRRGHIDQPFDPIAGIVAEVSLDRDGKPRPG